MLDHKLMIDAEIVVEASGDGGHHALPIHCGPPQEMLSAITLCATRDGKYGSMGISLFVPVI